MNTCIIIGMIVVKCVSAEKLTPAQAADILRPNQHVSAPIIPLQPMGGSIRRPKVVEPQVIYLIHRQEFPNMPNIGRRLDGTPLWMPPTVYGGRRRR